MCVYVSENGMYILYSIDEKTKNINLQDVNQKHKWNFTHQRKQFLPFGVYIQEESLKTYYKRVGDIYTVR